MANIISGAAIENSVDVFFEALRNKNAEVSNQLLHDAFVFTSPRGVVMNKGSFVGDFIEVPSIQFDYVKLEEQHSVTISETGMCTGKLAVKFKDKDDMKLRFTLVFVSRATKWQVLAFHETLVP